MVQDTVTTRLTINAESPVTGRLRCCVTAGSEPPAPALAARPSRCDAASSAYDTTGNSARAVLAIPKPMAAPTTTSEG